MKKHQKYISVIVFLFFMYIPVSAFEKANGTSFSHDNLDEQQNKQIWATKKLALSSRSSEWIKIPYKKSNIKAWIDYPATRTKSPVIIVLHEIFGLTDSTRNTADELAANGFITITPDMASGLGPHGSDVEYFPDYGNTAGTLSSISARELFERIDAIFNYASSIEGTNKNIALVGLSWGGGVAFKYATQHIQQKLTVACIFYDAGPVNSESITVTKVPVYAYYAGLDDRINKTLSQTSAAAKKAGLTYIPEIYEGAEHGFMRIGEDPLNMNISNSKAAHDALINLISVLKSKLQ